MLSAPVHIQEEFYRAPQFDSRPCFRAGALTIETKAKVVVVDNDTIMANYLVGKLTSMHYEPSIAANPDDMFSMLQDGAADVILMEYSVAEAGEHDLPREIFAKYRLPVVVYGYAITSFLPPPVYSQHVYSQDINLVFIASLTITHDVVTKTHNAPDC